MADYRINTIREIEPNIYFVIYNRKSESGADSLHKSFIVDASKTAN